MFTLWFKYHYNKTTIGVPFGISRERVRQIINPLITDKIYKEREAAIKKRLEETIAELKGV